MNFIAKSNNAQFYFSDPSRIEDYRKRGMKTYLVRDDDSEEEVFENLEEETVTGPSPDTELKRALSIIMEGKDIG